MNALLNAAMGYSAPQGAPAKSNGTGDAGTHLSAALAAHKKGDHHGAKKHALAAVNRLHRMTQAAPQAAPLPVDPSAAPGGAVAP